MGRESPHEWFTAGEVADLSRRFAIDEVPTTKSGMIKWIKRQKADDPDGFGADLLVLSRKRDGRNGGGGTEYHWSMFCEAGPLISDALDIEAQRRETEHASPDDAGWFTADDVSWFAYVERICSVPHRATFLNSWVAERAKGRPNTFARDLARLSRHSPFGERRRQYHYTLFAFLPSLFGALEAEFLRRTISHMDAECRNIIPARAWRIPLHSSETSETYDCEDRCIGLDSALFGQGVS
jgi:hypothetical protein